MHHIGMAEWRNGPFSRGRMRNETQFVGGVRYKRMRFLAEWRNGPNCPGGMTEWSKKLSAEWRNINPWETPPLVLRFLKISDSNDASRYFPSESMIPTHTKNLICF